jgi:ATP-dependent Clp protease adapter protein ClpS
MVEDLVWLDVRDKPKVSSADREATVLVHHDDDTPDHYVILALQTTFGLSYELAEHITWVAPTKGSVPVVTRLRSEAERLVNKAHIDARLYGFPLTFSVAKAEDESKQEPRRAARRLALSGIILLCALLLAVGLAVADRAGDVNARDVASQHKSGLVCKEGRLPALVFGAPSSGGAETNKIAVSELVPFTGALPDRVYTVGVPAEFTLLD